MKYAKILPRLLLLFAVVAAVACTQKSSDPAKPKVAKVDGPRMVILGFDGVDPRRVADLVAAGKLPNIAGLAKNGHSGALQSTNPPQSPVAWSAFATGLPSGEHGIFDFIGRDPRSYIPKIATTKIDHAHVEAGTVSPATAQNLRLGDSFWDVIARAGVSVRTHTVPYAYPPPKDGARSLAGLGTPDVRGINSSFTLLTADKSRAGGKPPAGGQISILEPMADGGYRAMVQGPRIEVDGNRKKTHAAVVVRPAGEGLEVSLGGTKQTLKLDETGDHVIIQFQPSPSLTIKAATRVTVLKL